MEYCRYILSQSNNGIVNGFFDLDEEMSFEDFEEKLDDIVKIYKSNFRIKDKDFSYDELLLRTMEKFLRSDIIFWKKNEGDEVVYNLYKQTKEMLKNEREKFKNKKSISYDSMFEIITNFCILCSNTIQNENFNENEKIEIHFKTMNIDPIGIRNMIVVATDILNKKEKAEKIAEQQKKGVGVLAVPLMIASRIRIGVIPIVGPILASTLSTKTIWDAIYRDQTDKHHSLFLYLWCIISATYTRNEELKGMIEYGW